MTAIVPFSPSPNANFQFTPTLDGQQYTLIVTWNFAAQRWYINIYTLQGALVLCRPMTGSPPTANVSLTAGYFDTVLVFRVTQQQFEIDPATPTPYVRPAPP